MQHDVQLVCEMRGGEPYEYYSLGEHIVSAPHVCGGRLTFKYTRLDARWVLACIEAGESPEAVARDYRLVPEAVQELLRLAADN